MPRSLLPEDWRARIADMRGRGVYAGYANREKCIFIHIPKAAGTSVARTLFGESSRHIPYYEYQRANPEKFRNFFKFSFVRNPWDRLVSAYFFLKAGGMGEVDRRWASEVLAPFDSFEGFVRDWLSPASVSSWVHFRPQADFIADDNNVVMVDFVGRYEHLAKDYALVANRLGKHPSLPSMNRSSHLDYRSYYTPEAEEIVARVYARDIALFGYRFDRQPDWLAQ